MNKLILIGNGFDLAHGLPTSYGHFLKDFWVNLIHNYKEPFIKDIIYINHDHPQVINSYKENSITSFKEFKKSCIRYISRRFQKSMDSSMLTYELSISIPDEILDVYTIRNSFFYVLNMYFETHNWVDIENAYYDILTSLVKSEESTKYGYIGDIDTLNKEFNEIKNLLEKYIKEKVLETHDFNYRSEQDVILNNFKNSIYYIETQLNNGFEVEYLNEFAPNDKDILIEKENEFIRKKDKLNVYINEILFLDFNYTRTVDTYISALNYFDTAFYPKPIHISIHGKIDDSYNPINFGFGDEMDDNYKTLEKTGDNKYLENIKSFMYLNNSNYKKLLNWINNDKFQVYVMGHSCGLSDRTMLNTIFEHNNCRSIKVFYHKKNDESDNFTEIVQNISRHFNKKSLMREKLVDKSLSKPLPQTARFKEL